MSDDGKLTDEQLEEMLDDGQHDDDDVDEFADPEEHREHMRNQSTEAAWAEYLADDPPPAGWEDPQRNPETGLMPWETPWDLVQDAEVGRHLERLEVLYTRRKDAQKVLVYLEDQINETAHMVEARLTANMENWSARKQRWIETQKTSSSEPPSDAKPG